MSELLMAAPMRIEAALISSAARGARVRKTGMGPAALQAAAGGAARASSGAGRCSCSASAAAWTRRRCPGEVIVAEEVYAAGDEGHAEQRVRCDLARPSSCGRLAGRGLKVRAGEVVCVSRLALGERRAQLHAGGAIAVDMESVWLAAGAGGRPFGVVRVVLDSPDARAAALRRPRRRRCARRARCAAWRGAHFTSCGTRQVLR